MPWLRHFDGVSYQVLPIAMTIAIALGLDYDIFLVSRIAEFRSLGCTNRASVVGGVACTGGIISGAGFIMVLAFAGLLAAGKPILHQLGFILGTSVALDAFLIRPLLVPALMAGMGRWNWWPYAMPPLEFADWREAAMMSPNGSPCPSPRNPIMAPVIRLWDPQSAIVVPSAEHCGEIICEAVDRVPHNIVGAELAAQYWNDEKGSCEFDEHNGRGYI